MHDPASKFGSETDVDYFRARAAAEIQSAKAAGARRATASADNRTLFITRPNGMEERLYLRRPNDLRDFE